MQRNRPGYRSSPDKDLVRDHFDLPLLKKFSDAKDKKLRYFGLPGADCRDIQAWREFIGEVVAVERHPRNLNDMEVFLDKYLNEIRYHTHFGDVDDVILSDHGNERKVGGQRTLPRVGNLYDSSLDRNVWGFDVVYLDYFGPFLPVLNLEYPDARRHRTYALLRLFEQERIDARESWLLLLTFEGGGYSDDDIELLSQYLQSARTDASDDTRGVLDYLLKIDGGDADRVAKLVHGAMSILVSSAASSAKLEVQPRGTLRYMGFGGQHMVHLAFQLEPVSGLLGGVVSSLPLLRAPILRAVSHNNSPRFEWAQMPCPGTTQATVRECLDFLDTRSLDQLLDGLPA